MNAFVRYAIAIFAITVVLAVVFCIGHLVGAVILEPSPAAIPQELLLGFALIISVFGMLWVSKEILTSIANSNRIRKMVPDDEVCSNLPSVLKLVSHHDEATKL